MITLAPIGRNAATICSALLAALFITSCENEPLQDGLQTSQLLSASTTSALEAVNELIPYNNCESDCIEEGSGIYYVKTDSESKPTSTNSNPNANTNTKLVSYEAFNTETEFVVKVFYDIIEGNSNSKTDITVTINGQPKLFEDVEKGSTEVYSLPLTNGWKACDLVSFSISQEGLGQPITFSDSYALIGICQSCEETFSYTQNDDTSYTFTYISEEDLTDAEVKFTCPHIVDFTSLDEKVYAVNPGNGNGSPTVLSWTGDIPACSPITFTILFDADCDQNNAGFANLFTDFKVNEVSKKGDAENIVHQCEE